VPDPKNSRSGTAERSPVVVTTKPTDEEGAQEPVSIVEDGEREPAPVEEGPLTIGEIVDGAKDVIDDVSTHARRLIDRGRYRKLRVTRKGKAVLPDIPLAAVAALEAASMYGAGIWRTLAVNVGGKFLFDVEVVNEADKYYERGKQAVLDGDLDRALEALMKAIRIDDTHAGAHLQTAVLYRLRGEPEKARPFLLRARQLDENGEIGRRADEIIRALDDSGA
jgi:tetratricopeptide (TPR) repeat protein